MALRWLRLHRGEAVAPMHFPTLVAQSDLPADVVAVVDDLLARKAVTREFGSGSLATSIGTLIDTELATAREEWSKQAWRPEPPIIEAANMFLRRWVAP